MTWSYYYCEEIGINRVFSRQSDLTLHIMLSHPYIRDTTSELTTTIQQYLDDEIWRLPPQSEDSNDYFLAESFNKNEAEDNDYVSLIEIDDESNVMGGESNLVEDEPQ
ncbi:26119_t:CDS:2, partial [Racocetra persica]